MKQVQVFRFCLDEADGQRGASEANLKLFP